MNAVLEEWIFLFGIPIGVLSLISGGPLLFCLCPGVSLCSSDWPQACDPPSTSQALDCTHLHIPLAFFTVLFSHSI